MFEQRPNLHSYRKPRAEMGKCRLHGRKRGENKLLGSDSLTGEHVFSAPWQRMQFRFTPTMPPVSRDPFLAQRHKR